MKEESVLFGRAVFTYNKLGAALSVQFIPGLETNVDPNYISALLPSDSAPNTPEELAVAASIKVNSIQHAYPIEEELVTRVVECLKYENGNIQRCELEFFIQLIKPL